MRKLLFASFAIAAIMASCSDDDNNGTPNPGPDPSGDTVSIRGVLTGETKLEASKVYKLRGYVYVPSGSTLTIEAGTTILSTKDSAGVLLIAKGATIDARGTAAKPIVFTSGEKEPVAGDLGGIIIAGDATTNGNHSAIEGSVDSKYGAFGGNNDADNSGYLQYVRIEYAGKAVAADDEVNGLSLYGVGSGTTIDHIQVVRGLDDAYEFFGGAVEAKYLIAYNTADDDFDFDDGFHGKIQFAVSIKDPKFVDNKSGGDYSNNFEFDNSNGKKPFDITPFTYPILSNFTLIGPNNAAGTVDGYGYNMRIRRGTKFVLGNSVVLGGQKAGLDLDNDLTVQNYIDGESGLRNSLISSVTETYKVDLLTNTGLLDAAGLKALVETRDNTVSFTSPADVKLTDPFNNAAPNLAPATGSPALTGAAFTDQLADGFFTKVTYRGAIDPASDWTKDTWTVWNR